MYIINKFTPFIHRYKLQVSIFIITSILSWSVSVIMPFITGRYIDTLVALKDKKYVYMFTLLVLILNFFNMLTKYFSQKANTKLTNNIIYDMASQVFEHLKKVPISFIKSYDSSYLSQRINGDTSVVVSFFISNCLSVFTQMLTLLTSFIILFRINPFIFIVILCTIPINIVLYTKFKKSLFETNYKLMEHKNKYFASINELFRHIKFVKTNLLFSETKNKLDNKFKSLYDITLKFFKLDFAYSNSSSIIIILLNVFIAFYGGLSVINGDITIGSFTIINTYFSMIFSSINYYMMLGGSYQQAKVSAVRINELLDIKCEHNGKRIINDIHSIRLENITFAYENDSIIIKDFSYEFKKGNIYLLTGKNGAGKSTLANIILGLHIMEYSGNIFFNDTDIIDLDIYHIRRHLIAVSEQESSLMDNSIAENMIIGIDNTDNEKLLYWQNEMALFIKANSTNVSGGEKQKIFFIRTLLKNSPVLLLDEPTSALDDKSTAKLKELLIPIKKDKIIIIITHDSVLTDICDYTLNL